MNPRQQLINETCEPATWPEILSNPPFMRGYADYWTGAPWPDDDPVGNYEIGRLFAAELDGLGEGAPKVINPMRRLNNGWKRDADAAIAGPRGPKTVCGYHATRTAKPVLEITEKSTIYQPASEGVHPPKIPREKPMVAQTSIKAALKYLRRHLMGYSPGSPQYEYHADKVRCSGRPMATAKRICAEHSAAKATAQSNRFETLDPSDVQELWAKFCRRQGGISSEQAKIFRDLDRRALQGLLTGGELKTAEKTLRLLKPTQDKAWFQDEREAEVHRSGCKRQQPHLRELAMSLPRDRQRARRMAPVGE